jgi:hypothetical protein
MTVRFLRGMLVLAGLVLMGLAALVGSTVWQAWQATPAQQFNRARQLWEARPFQHYRLAAAYENNWAQCYYDIEVRAQRIGHVFGLTCISAAETQTLTVDGIFQVFERYVAGRVCSASGCYCDGSYVVRATYDATWGYPRRITTGFQRNWLDDLLRGKAGVRQCVRTDSLVEKIEVDKITPLP